MSKFIFGASAMLLATAALGQHRAAPHKHATHAKYRAAAKPKQSPSDALAASVTELQSLTQMSDASVACTLSTPDRLLWSLKNYFGASGLIKGEFETSETFAEREQKAEAILNGTSGIIVCVRPDDAYFTLKYDADSASFRGSFNPNLVVDNSSKDLGSYRSETAMGAKATVYSELLIQYHIDMGRWLTKDAAPCLQIGFDVATFDAPVPVSEAPIVKSSGYLAIYGRVRSPFIDYEEHPGSPTIDDPFDTYVVTLTAPLQPTKFMLVAPDGSAVWTCEVAS